MIITLVLLLLVHYIADFLCQTRTMANNKSSSIKWLSLHVLTYGIVLSIFTFIYGLQGLYFLDKGYEVFWTFIGVNVVLHWITDFTTSKFTTHFYKKENWFAFFCIVGLDQLLHTVSLLLTFNYFYL